MVKTRRSESKDNLVVTTRISNKRTSNERRLHEQTRLRTRLEQLQRPTAKDLTKRYYNVSTIGSNILPKGAKDGQTTVIDEDEEMISDFDDIKDAIQRNRESIPRYVCIFIFILIAAYQSERQAEEYLKYPTGVNVLVELPPSLQELLPGLTLCDNNLVQMDKIRDNFTRWLKDNGLDTLPTEKYELHKKLEQFLKVNYLHEFAGPMRLFNLSTSAPEFIRYLKCDPGWLTEEDTFKECEDIPIFTSLHFNAKCFTLFHKLAFDKNLGPKIGELRKNSLKKNPKETIETYDARDVSNNEADETMSYMFDPSEVIQIMVDFQPNQTTNLYQELGGRLYIHDSLHIPGSQEIHYDIRPGYYYEFYVRRITTKQLPRPYNTNCSDYFNLNIDWIREKSILGKPLTQEECINDCISRRSVLGCFGMFPPEDRLLYRNIYEKFNMSINRRNQPMTWTGLRWGAWRNEGASFGARAFQWGCSFFHKPMCVNECGVECEKSTYEVIEAKTKWPFKDIIETATEEQMVEIEERSNSSAYISIRYSDFVQTVRDFEPRFATIEGFMAGIGGLISMWVGISIISLFDIIDYIVTKVSNIKC